MLDVNADPNNQANVDLLQNLAVKWGLVDQATADAMQAANEATGIIDTRRAIRRDSRRKG